MLNLIWKISLLAVVVLDALQNVRALSAGVELRSGKFSQWLNAALLAVIAAELGFDIIAGK